MQKGVTLRQALSELKVAGNRLTFENRSIIYSGLIIDTDPHHKDVGLILNSFSRRKVRSRFELTFHNRRVIRVPDYIRLFHDRLGILNFAFRPWKDQGFFTAHIHPEYVLTIPKPTQ